jgi:hypothetical protein
LVTALKMTGFWSSLEGGYIFIPLPRTQMGD